MASEILLEARRIVKDFPSTRALDNVSFDVRRGEVHALVGENGAGKSTLVKIICGAYRPNAGSLWIEGREIKVHSPHDAFKIGVATVYQEFNLLPDLSVLANLYLGREETALGFLRKKHMARFARENCARVGLEVDERTPVAKLSMAEKQLLEIAKAIAFKAKVIFMDEPTAVLTEIETRKLFEVIRLLKAQGLSVVYISHRINELFEIADRVTVLKDGKHVVTSPIGDFKSGEDIVKLMIGRETSADYYGKAREKETSEKVVLSVQGLAGGKVKDASLELHEGEILGLAGLVGSGRTEIIRLITGADKKRTGRISVGGHKVRINSPRDSIRNRIGYVPEDRALQGVILDWGIVPNLSLAALKSISSVGFVRTKEERSLVKDCIDRLRIKTAGLNVLIKGLSGGNQQKVAVAKWLATNSKILILDEPTRGIDVGAKADIYRILRQLSDEGISLIIVSSELQELLNLCDRIIVVRNGRIITSIPRRDATEEVIMMYATGQVTSL